jgi:hypothetical protein
MGGSASEPFDADLPSDGEPCTEDVCKDGSPSHFLPPVSV